MRRWLSLLLAFFCLILPVSAQTVYNGGEELGSVVWAEGEKSARLEIQNDTANSIYVFASIPGAQACPITLAVRQSGKTLPVFEGDAAALKDGKLLLCTLEPQGSAEITAKRGNETAFEVLLTVQRAEETLAPDYARLIFYICLWMLLVVLGSYITIVLSNRFSRKK